MVDLGGVRDGLRAAVYGVGVSLAVFAYLALPTLRELYGPAVNVPVYAGVALVAGVLAYSLVRRVQGVGRGAGDREDTLTIDGEVYRLSPDDADADRENRPQPDVDAELEQIKDER